jgi:hypothetical protein
MIIKEKIVDLTTGTETIIDRELTAEELVAYEEDQARIEAEEAELAAKAAARQAVLDKLGLTKEDLEALGL